MTATDLNAALAHAGNLDRGAMPQTAALIRRLVATVRRERDMNVRLARRLAAASEVLGRCAERGKVELGTGI